MRKMLPAPLKRLIQLLLALVILFEEWGWEPLHRVMARIGGWPVFRQIEAGVRRLPPYLALAALLVPSVLLVPVKLLAVWLIGAGHAFSGLAVIITAKVVGTAVIARLFALTQPTLMQLAWFVRLHARWMTWKSELLSWVRTSTVWRTGRALKLRLRRLLRRGETQGGQVH